LPSIFDPYFTTKTEGSGLGLWIAQQIVTAHGGTLSAQNSPGRGAIFTIWLPLTRKNQGCG
jgi:two-component system sensor histidine kinase HydH